MDPGGPNEGRRPEIDDIVAQMSKMRAKETEAKKVEQTQGNKVQNSRFNVTAINQGDKTLNAVALFYQNLDADQLRYLLHKKNSSI